MCNRQDIRDRIARVRYASEDNAARTIFGGILAAHACFIPPQVSVTNDLAGLGREESHPTAVKSFRNCSERLPMEFPHSPERPTLRQSDRTHAWLADPGFVDADILPPKGARHRRGHG